MQEIAGESNMQRYEKLLRNLYGADLFYGKIDLKVNYSFSCYFIVQHTNEEEFISGNSSYNCFLPGARNLSFTVARQMPGF